MAGAGAGAGACLKWLGLIGPVLIAGSASAQDAIGQRRLVTVAAGETITLAGEVYRASTPLVAVTSLSSDLATLAVLDGTVAGDRRRGRAGDALVTVLDSGKTMRFGFDAQRLAATLPAAWIGQAGPLLDRIAARQRRQRFWGRIEPAALNASAPSTPQVETVRAGYLANETVAGLRRAGKGNPQALAAATATRFAQALAAGDAETAGALLDPKPFTDSGAEPATWQAARLSFARRLTGDPQLAAVFAAAPEPVAGDQTAFAVGPYLLRIVPRDRAMFVAAVEAKP